MMVPLDPMVVMYVIMINISIMFIVAKKDEILRSLQKNTCKGTDEMQIFAQTQKLYIQII